MASMHQAVTPETNVIPRFKTRSEYVFGLASDAQNGFLRLRYKYQDLHQPLSLLLPENEHRLELAEIFQTPPENESR